MKSNNNKDVIFINDMPQVSNLKSLDLSYQINGRIAIKKLKEKYSNELKIPVLSSNTRKDKKKDKDKDKDKEVTSRSAVQIELAKRVNRLEKISRANEIIGLALEDGICRLWQNSSMTDCALIDISLFLNKKPSLVEQKFKFQQRFEGFAKKIITSLRDGGGDDFLEDSIQFNDNKRHSINNKCRGLCKFGYSPKFEIKDNCKCLFTTVKIQLNEFNFVLDSMLANIIAYDTFPTLNCFTSDLFDWIASYLVVGYDSDLKLLALIEIIHLSYILTTRFPSKFKIDDNTLFVGKVIAITMNIVKSFKKCYNEDDHIKNYLFSLTVKILRSFLNTSISDYRVNRNKLVKKENDVFYLILGTLTYNENSLIHDVIYWINIIIGMRNKSSDEKHKSNFLKFCDVKIGSMIVIDFYAISTNILLTWGSKLMERNNKNADEKLKASLLELIDLVSQLSLISMKQYCYFFGDYHIKTKEFTISDKQEKKMESMLGTNPFLHSKLCLLNYVYSDTNTTTRCDDEVVVSFKAISASFCNNTISKSTVLGLLHGRKIARRRLECHIIQLTFWQTFLSLLLCINDGATFDDNSILVFEKKRKKDSLPEQVINDIELLSSAEITVLLIANIMRDITRSLSFHKQSLTIMHPGLLICRLILNDPYMSKKKVNEFLSTDDDFADSDDDMDEEDPELKEFCAWQNEFTKVEIEKCGLTEPKHISFPELLIYISQNHIQNMEILEQFLCLCYQIVTSSHLAKVALIEVNMPDSIKRILDLQSDNVYIIAFCQLILEAIDKDILG